MFSKPQNDGNEQSNSSASKQKYRIGERDVSYWTARRVAKRNAEHLNDVYNTFITARAKLRNHLTEGSSTISDDIVPPLSNEPDVPLSSPSWSEPPSPDPCEPPSMSSFPSAISSLSSICDETVTNQPGPPDEENQDSISSDDELNVAKEAEDLVSCQIRKIQRIFVKYPQLSRNCKNDILECLKEITTDTQNALPKDSRSLRLKPMKYSTYNVDPGRVCYFGISRVLNTSIVKLFNPKQTTIKLIMNIDGVPLFRCSKNGLWPILGTVDCKRVFIIGFYFGIKKPKCSNEFIRPVVDEIISLQRNGIRVNKKTYQFRLERIVMDAVARSYILGVRNHRGKKPCQRCHVRGAQVNRSGFASTSVQRSSKKRTNAYLDLNAEPRKIEEFSAEDHRPSPVPECDPQCTSGGCWDDDTENICTSDNIDCSDDELDSNSDVNIIPDKEYIRHRTLLLKIPGFDIIRCVVLDYLHLVCLGVMDKLLVIWKREEDILSSENKKRIDEMIITAKKYIPVEFQRQPETLENLTYWKGTQFRDFLLYVSVPVLLGSMQDAFLQNFIYLVVAMRAMVRRRIQSAAQQKFIANNARQCLHKFVEQSIVLYGPEFVIYNVHSLIHLPDDYELFGPLDTSSAYTFESFNGILKKYVNGGSADPLKQIVNVYSNRLGLGQFCNDEEEWDEINEYFEHPNVYDHQRSVDTQEDQDTPYDGCEQYLKMKFKNFVLRTDNDRDSFCVVSSTTGIHFMKVEKILKTADTNEYYITGKCYEDVRSLFDVPCSSLDVGMARCSNPSIQSKMFPVSQLKNKCFAFPIIERDLYDTEWAFIEFLH